jgi:hypothetical protein
MSVVHARSYATLRPEEVEALFFHFNIWHKILGCSFSFIPFSKPPSPKVPEEEGEYLGTILLSGSLFYSKPTRIYLVVIKVT